MSDACEAFYEVHPTSSCRGLVDRHLELVQRLQSLAQKIKLRSNDDIRSQFRDDVSLCQDELVAIKTELQLHLDHADMGYDDLVWVVYEDNDDAFIKDENKKIIGDLLGKLAERPHETIQVPIKVTRQRDVYVGYVYTAVLYHDFVELKRAHLPPDTTAERAPALCFTIARRGFIKSRIMTVDGPFGKHLDTIADHLRGQQPMSSGPDRRSILLEQHAIVKPQHLRKSWLP